ncbi:MAG: AbgT family transporter, partial [Bowdeniella nasicola]|nr:AbgT family transporter [Bowdeniella nasicola]
YFNIASSIILALIAGFIIDRVVEPRLNRLGVSREYVDHHDDDNLLADVPVRHTTDNEIEVEPYRAGEELSLEISSHERRALRWSLIAAGLLTAVMLIALLIPTSPWRNEEGGFLPSSPLLKSIVFIVFAYFLVMGLVYGKLIGVVNNTADMVNFMMDALKDVLGFL